MDVTKPFTVLAVDDQQPILEGLALIIEIAGGEAILADSGMEALKSVQTDHKGIDLVILDMGMPDLTGEEVAYKIREIDSNMPIIISSGFAEHQLMDQIQLNERVSFVRKPYLIDTMIETIKEMLRARVTP